MSIRRKLEEKLPGAGTKHCTFWHRYREEAGVRWVHPDAYHVTLGTEHAWSCPHCHQVLDADQVGASRRVSVLKPLGKHQLARYSRYRLACAAIVTFSAAFLIYGLQSGGQTWFAKVGIAFLIMAMPFLVSVILLLEEQISSGYETHNGAKYVQKQMGIGGILTWGGLILFFWEHSHFFALIFLVFSLLGVRLVLATGMEEMAARVVLQHAVKNRKSAQGGSIGPEEAEHPVSSKDSVQQKL